MREVYRDAVNPFTVFEIEEGQPFPLAPQHFNMKAVGINIAYIKPDGSVEDEPSFCFVMQDQHRNRYYSEVTLKTLKPMISAALAMEEKQRRKNEIKQEMEDSKGDKLVR